MNTICHLTDIHIPEEGVYPFDKDARKQFLNALEDIRKIGPDLLVVTGDLCYREGHERVYRWIKQRLDDSGIDYRVIAGNHDDSRTMASIFNCKTNRETGECYYSETLDGLDLIFLDTAVGKCSSDQWTWLEAKLKALKGFPMVFMHHPPIKAGVRHMDDNYPFLEPEKAFEVFSVLEESVNVFCGHYHVERSLHTGLFNVHITPSTLFALDPWSEEAEIAGNIPAYRTIQILENGATIRHFVTYQEPVPAPK